MDDKITGFYKHYKGGIYEVCGWGCLESNEQEMVIYRPADNSDKVWIRPWLEFQSKFEYIKKQG